MLGLHARIRKFIRDPKGVAAIELAFIAPLLLLLYFGTVDLGNWYMAHRRLVVAGSTVTDLTTQSQGQVTKAEIDAFWNGIGRIIAPLKLANVTMTMRAFRKKDGAVKRSTTQITVKKVEYLDYDSGARIGRSTFRIEARRSDPYGMGMDI